MEQTATICRTDAEPSTSVAGVETGVSKGRILQLRPGHSSRRVEPELGEEATIWTAVATPRAGEFLIRLLDIVGSLAVLVLVLPVIIVSALFIKITSDGPVFYKRTCPANPIFSPAGGEG